MTVTVIGSMIVCVCMCAFSRVVKSSEAAILKWATIGQTSPNANIDNVMNSRDVKSDEPAILKWAIIGQTSQTLKLAM